MLLALWRSSADHSSQPRSFDWVSQPFIEPQAQSPPFAHSERFPLDTDYNDLSFSSQDSIPDPSLASWPGVNGDQGLPRFGHTWTGDGSYPLESDPTSNIHCHWIGCKAKQMDFLTPADLHRHTLTYHLQRCPWPSCRTRNAFRRRCDLNRHIESVHSGRRRFVCEVPDCRRAFARSDKLTAHKKVHGMRSERRKAEAEKKESGILDSESASSVVTRPQCASCTKMQKLQVVTSEVKLPFQPELPIEPWSGWSNTEYAPVQKNEEPSQFNLSFQPEATFEPSHEAALPLGLASLELRSLEPFCDWTTMSSSSLQSYQYSQIANLDPEIAATQQHHGSSLLVFRGISTSSDIPSSPGHYDHGDDK